MEAQFVSLDLKYFLSLNIKAFVSVGYITLAYSIRSAGTRHCSAAVIVRWLLAICSCAAVCVNDLRKCPGTQSTFH